MTAVIRVQNLSKRYRLGASAGRGYCTLRESVMDALAAPIRRLVRAAGRGPGERPTEHWALRDVSVEIGAGEVVGVIGRNGAGKSTLLKVLSRITEPTAGRVELRGRVGSLLEVGVGFHPELTGRENIALNGAILGMTRREIARQFDAIVDFAEVGPFLDTPVKRYSSGMYVRLAFAVAAHLEPEILLVDEVLAVGDYAFQKKCLGKMQEVSRGGRTVLFVSHSLPAVLHLCDRVVLLERGRVAYVGAADEGVKRYLDTGANAGGGETDLRGHPARRPGCPTVLERVRFLDRDGRVRDRFQSGEAVILEFAVNPPGPLADPQFGIGVDDWTGARVFSLATYLSHSRLPALRGPCTVRCGVAELPLAPGRYLLSLSAGTPQNPCLDALDQAVALEVEPSDYYGNGRLAPGLGRVLVRSVWERGEPC
jgi:lipopolysaccharide transport system ATP-binding protein